MKNTIVGLVVGILLLTLSVLFPPTRYEVVQIDDTGAI